MNQVKKQILVFFAKKKKANIHNFIRFHSCRFQKKEGKIKSSPLHI